MNQIRGIVIATLLAVWSFPAVSSAKTPPVSSPGIERAAAPPEARPPRPATDSEAASLAARQSRSRALEDFRGGSGVYIYVGSGVLLVLVIVLLIVLVA
jgi:hypothetical protein